MRLHQLDLLLAEHVAGLFGEHDVERHQVGLAQQRLVVDGLDAVGEELRRLHIGIVGDHAAAPRRQQLRDAAGDAAEADEADGLAAEAVGGAGAEVVGEIVRGAPFAVAHVGVAVGELLEQRQHHRHRGLGDAEAVRLGRRVADHDAELGRGFGVDVVDADGVFGDDAQPLRRLHHAAADRGVAHRGAHQRHAVARLRHHVVLVMRARQLPVAVADHDLAAEPLDRLDGLGRLLARGEDQDFRLVGHGNSVGRGFAR